MLLLEELRKHDLHVVLDLLSGFEDQHGDVSLPAFYGCMQALTEASPRLEIRVQNYQHLIY